MLGGAQADLVSWGTGLACEATSASQEMTSLQGCRLGCWSVQGLWACASSPRPLTSCGCLHCCIMAPLSLCHCRTGV